MALHLDAWNIVFIIIVVVLIVAAFYFDHQTTAAGPQSETPTPDAPSRRR